MTRTGLKADYAGAKVKPSPNFNERRNGRRPDIILIHYTGMETGRAAERRLADPASEVSCHYVVRESGVVVQMVPEAARAWHAGQGAWKGEHDINSASIGIEIVNRGHEFDYPDFPAKQIGSVIALCRDIAARWAILPERVLGHSDIAPGRKVDPGEKFPWRRLAEAGVGHFVDAAPARGGRFLARGDSGQPVEALQSLLALYGYNIEISGIFDKETEDCVVAFQQHFRQENTDGVADVSTIETLHALLAALPVR